MNVIVDSLLVNYERTGSGKPVLLLHGWGDTLRTFDLLLKNLKGDYELITLDLPGFGGTQRPQEAWGLEEYARFVAAFLRKIEVSDAYAVVGHSNGGAIAIKGLAHGSIKAKKLVLIASAGIRARDTGKKLAWKIVAKSGKAATAILPAATRKKLRGRLYKGIGSDYLVVPEMEATFKKVVSQDVQSDALQLSTPALLVYGREDTATPSSYGEAVNGAIANSKLHIVDGAGHFVHQERAHEVASLVKEFLK